MYTVFVPDYLKVSNTPENAIQNKIRSFITTEAAVELVFVADFYTYRTTLLQTPNSFYIDFMSEMPLEFKDGAVPAALSERKDPQMQMAFLQSGLDLKNDTKHKSLIEVAVLNMIHAHALEKLDVQFQAVLYNDYDWNHITNHLNEKRSDALFVGASLVPFFVTKEPFVLAQNYHFSEIAPIVGSGTLCAITHENQTATRQFLRNFHHLPTAECVNIERQLKKLAGINEVNAYVYTDINHYFHLYAACTDEEVDFKKVQLSRSTSFELAETAWKELQK